MRATIEGSPVHERGRRANKQIMHNTRGCLRDNEASLGSSQGYLGTMQPMMIVRLPEALEERLDKIILRIADQYPGVDPYLMLRIADQYPGVDPDRLEKIYWGLVNTGYDYLSVRRIARKRLIQRILSEEYPEYLCRLEELYCCLRVEPQVTQTAPPQTRTSAINTSGSSVSRFRCIDRVNNLDRWESANPANTSFLPAVP